MQTLKVFVIGMGVLLLAGFVVVVFTVIERATETVTSEGTVSETPTANADTRALPSTSPVAPSAVTPSAVPPIPVAPTTRQPRPTVRAPIPPIAIPAGARLREIVPSDRYLVLHFTLPQGGDLLRIIDLHAGGEALDVEIEERP